MPTYQFRNKETHEAIELVLSFSGREAYLAEHPEMEQYHTEFPAMGDSVRLGIRKVDRGFNDVLQKIKSKHPKSTIQTR